MVSNTGEFRNTVRRTPVRPAQPCQAAPLLLRLDSKIASRLASQLAETLAGRQAELSLLIGASPQKFRGRRKGPPARLALRPSGLRPFSC